MPVNNDGKKWIIQSDILYELLTYGDGLHFKQLPINSNWSIGHHISAAKGIITWLASQALNLHRAAWHPDTCFSGHLKDLNVLRESMAVVLSKPADVSAAVAELKDIVNFVQSQVKQRPDCDGTHITLGRAYIEQEHYVDGATVSTKYASTMLRMAQAAGILGLTSIDAPHDTLTSWSKVATYPKPGVKVDTPVPVEDIFCASEYIQSRGLNSTAPAIESGEWIVLTRNPQGMRTIPIEHIREDRLSVELGVDPAKKNLVQKIIDDGFIQASLHTDIQWGKKSISYPKGMTTFQRLKEGYAYFKSLSTK